MELIRDLWYHLRLDEFEDMIDVLIRLLPEKVKTDIMTALKPHLVAVYKDREDSLKEGLVSMLDAYEDGAEKTAVLAAIAELKAKGDPDLTLSTLPK